MTDLATPTVEAEVPSDPASDGEAEISSKKSLGIAGWLSVGWLSALAFIVVFADFLPFEDPYAELGTPLLAPGQGGFLLGLDANGRDVLARLVYGGRNSVIISVGSISAGFLIGGLLGLLSGYYRNWIGKVLAGLFDILLAIPALVLALALVAVLKGDPTSGSGMDPLWILVLTLAVVSIPLIARITRASTMAWSQRDFVTAARAQGATDRRILFREILPNVLPAMVYIALLGIAIAIVAEGSLAILGASVEPPETTWGTMIVDGKSQMEDAPFLMFVPIIALFVTVLSLNFLGDAIRDRFDVRESAL
ncbi:MAG: ABC transporter permease [Acidimicrobiales bacterium]|nr:ABC transporter permease [Acidimicrobiales bacterium]